jgi:hypothetical protein
MAFELKPLFNPEIVRQRLLGFTLPDSVELALPRVRHWAELAPARLLVIEAVQLEHQLSDPVNEAYGLTPEEVELMWQTAPPRMPISKPV